MTNSDTVLYIYIYIYIYIYDSVTYICICVCIYISVCVFVYISVCVCVCAYFWNLFSYAAKSFQSCPTLCDPIDISPTGSPAPGILQARTLEWVAISFFYRLLQNTEYTSLCYIVGHFQ